MIIFPWSPLLLRLMLTRQRRKAFLLLGFSSFRRRLVASLVELDNPVDLWNRAQHAFDFDRLPLVHSLEVFLLLTRRLDHIRQRIHHLLSLNLIFSAALVARGSIEMLLGTRVEHVLQSIRGVHSVIILVRPGNARRRH